MKINAEEMKRAFREVNLSHDFNFDWLEPRKIPIEDIRDIGELSVLLESTIELQGRTNILGMIRVRAEALLNKKSGLRDYVELYFGLPKNSEAERLVGARIVKLLRDKVAEFPDFQSAYEGFEHECGDMEFFHETLMRLIGEKFFPAP